MANYRFLDHGGLLVYHRELEKLLNKKLNIEQGVEHGNKFMMVNDTTGMLEPRPIGDLGLVDDVKVDGVSVVAQRVAAIDLEGPLSEKQDNLSPAQLDVLDGVQFSPSEQSKLSGIAAGAQVNIIESISVNGTALTPDIDKEVEITVPTALTQLSTAGFAYVKSLTALTSNVTIGGTAPDLTITVEALEMPDEFTSEESPDPDSSIGDPLSGQDAELLTPIKTGAVLSESDVVIFANNIQAVVTKIYYDVIEEEKPLTYDAIITRVPSEVSFAGITGSPMSNANLASALDAKLNTGMDNASIPLGPESINLGKYLYVGAGGAVAFGDIIPIANQDILALFEEEPEE